MQRAHTVTSTFMRTRRFFWLPSLALAVLCVCGHAMASRAESGSDSEQVPQRWRNYALSSITPAFAWAERADASVPTVTDAPTSRLSLSQAFGHNSSVSLDLSTATSIINDRVKALSGSQLDVQSSLPGAQLKRTVIAPSVVGAWGQNGTYGVTAILAYQRFASLGMGESNLAEGLPIWPLMPGETSYGAGVRLDVGSQLAQRLSWSAAVQSRVDMDALNTLRGVYTDPGQFDIPASASVGLSYALSPMLSVDVGVQRVRYSDVTPFTSPALPRRFLALLGSGASPEFRWDDLNVYSMGWTLHGEELGNLELRYTSRQQPMPSSSLLREALEVDPADHTVAVGYSRDTGRHARLSLQAIYSSAPYFLGVPSYRSTDRVTGNQVEYEAAWSVRF